MWAVRAGAPGKPHGPETAASRLLAGRSMRGCVADAATAAAVLLLLVLAVGTAEGGACSMDVIGDKWAAFTEKQLVLRAARQAKESSMGMQGERVRAMMNEAQPAPIRIKLITQLDGTHLDAASAKRLEEQLGPGAVRVVQKFVQVRVPRKFSIRMPKPESEDEMYCNDAYAKALWDKGGVKGYDLVLFLTANRTKDCRAGALAYTLPCLTDLVTGRPIAAGMNVCPLSARSAPRRLLNTLVHEMVHALGFSGQLFPLYYDSRTWNPYKKSEQVAVEFSMERNKTTTEAMYIAFPAVKELAQKHYGCDALPGAPADVGSFASHFKQRLSGHELMMPATSEDGQEKAVTNFTLTLLDSTGWYVTRKDLAQPALFGAGAGCDLAMDTCESYVAKTPGQNLYCAANKKDADQCTFDHRGIGVCVEGIDEGCLLSGASMLRGVTLTCSSTSSWSTMRHQAFLYHHGTLGGTVGSPSSRCYGVEDGPRACRLEPGASEPTCLMRQAMCLETRCDARGVVQAVFKFGGDSVIVPCPEGATLDLAKALPGRGFTSGKLRCPSSKAVCPTLGCAQPCGRGSCFQGRCICNMEYVGPRCEQSLVPGWT